MNFLKNNWYWLLPVVLFAVLAGVQFYAAKKKTANVVAANTAGLNKTVELFNGIKGYQAEVMYLQRWLNARGGQLEVDGIFGPLTAAELKKQKGVWNISISEL